MKFVGFWQDFSPNNHLIGSLFEDVKRDVRILGPFSAGIHCNLAQKLKLKKLISFAEPKADFFITGENCEPQFRRARKQIGFWRRYPDRNDVFRFPNWMWHLDWPELEHQPPYPRYGMRLSIDRLMRPINETYSKRQLEGRVRKAVLFSKHLRDPRKRLFELTKKDIGCDGFGGAFGNDNRQQPKMTLMERYRFSLCPENSIGDGYVTEKIPESFHSGCIPIAWCTPEDLAEDFNPRAVVNLYGLDNQQCSEILKELQHGREYFEYIVRQPLLLKRPSLKPLLEFIHGT